MAKPETLVIGIDGGTFNLMRPWVDAGYLPYIGGMMKNGLHGTLRSTYTPNTCPAWASFATGKNPGQLGVFDWKNKRYGSYEVQLAEPGTLDSMELWDYLGDGGKKVALVGIPMTYPPRPVNGVMLTGMLTPPDATFAYPEELVQEIEEHIGEYSLDPAIVSIDDEDVLAEEQNRITVNRFQVLRHILQRDSYDFVMVVFTAADRLQHLFWPPDITQSTVWQTYRSSGSVLKAYKQIDWAISELAGLAGPDTNVMLMSDHGFTHLERQIHTNQILSDMGLLVAENQGRGLMQRAGVTRQNVGRVARKLGLDQLRAHLPEAAKNLIPVGLYGLDMKRTKAWAWSSGEIFINVRGREPEGIVESGDEYESIRGRIIDRLENLTDGDKQLDIRVHRREDIYTGRHLQEAPDLVIEVREPGYGLANNHTGMEINEILPGVEISDNPGHGGRHDTEGILVAQGPYIKKTASVQNASLIDLAPTILHLMGLSVPDDMDGNVLPIFADGTPPAQQPVEKAPAKEHEREKVPMSKEEQERLHTVLKAFGYLG